MFDLRSIIISVPAILFCLTIHEYAHGWVAYRLGDSTAKYAGRLTLNPFKHLDPIGTLSLFLFRLGWAKPVPINPVYFRNPKRDILLTSLAGPGSNFLAAVGFGAVLHFIYRLQIANAFLINILFMFVYFNIILGIFNLLPIPPLDGSKIVYYLLPDNMARQYTQVERYGFFILIGIIMLGYLSGFSVLSVIIQPVLNFFTSLIVS